MYHLPPTIPIIQIQMPNNDMKVAWAPANKKAKPPKKVELKNWQKRHLTTYKSMLDGGMMSQKEFEKQMNRHGIPKANW